MTGFVVHAVACLLSSVALGGEETSWFPDRPVAWFEHDDLDVPNPPRATHLQDIDSTLLWRDSVVNEFDRILELDRKHTAEDINSLDEVACSTWFCPRNHLRPMSPADVAAGPAATPPVLPLRIVKGKDQGATPGFQIIDAAGRKFMLKFDPINRMGLSSGPEMFGARIFHAAGYNVPGSFLVQLNPDDLVLDPSATFRLYGVQKRRLTDAHVRAQLAAVARAADGRIRATTIPWVPGRLLGGIDMLGHRGDDPNDRIPHQHRRSLRASWVLFAWLSELDPGSINSLDAYVSENGRRFVRHYIIDFGAAFGGATTRPRGLHQTGEYLIEVGRTVGAFASLGLSRRPFQRERTDWETMIKNYPSVGWFPAETFDPDTFRTNRKIPAHMRRTDRDLYWGAKVVTSFSDAQIAAALATAQLPERDAAYLLHALKVRRDIIGRRYLGAMTAVEAPTIGVDGASVCFDDLAIERGYLEPRQVRYVVTVGDGRGGRVATAEVPAQGRRTCVPQRRRGSRDDRISRGRRRDAPGRRGRLSAHAEGRSSTPALARCGPGLRRGGAGERRMNAIGRLAAAILVTAAAATGAQAQATPPSVPPAPPSCSDPPESRPPDLRCDESLTGRPAAPPPNGGARLLLRAPRATFKALAWPFLRVGDFIEYHHLAGWMQAISTTDDGKIGIRPEVHYTSGFLPTGGARVFNRRLPLPGSELSARFLTAGPDALMGDVAASGPEWLGLAVRASWNRRRDRLFGGVGAFDEQQLAAQGRGETRFASDILLTEARWVRRLPGRLTLGLAGDAQRRDYDATSSSGTPVGAIYGLSPEACAQLGLRAGCVDPALVPGFDRGLRIVHAGGSLTLDLRSRARDGGGLSVGLDGTYGHGVAGDPSRHVLVGGEIVGSLGGLDRALLLRLRGAMVEKVGAAAIPFDELVSPSGPSGMRGFPSGRFRGESGVVASVEYRWFIAFNLDAALFCDVGTVAGRRFSGVETASLFPSYGVGVRWYNPAADYWRTPVQNGIQLAYAPDAGFRLMLSVAAF